ncbi:hypothetical protein EG833_02705 [archaeon]|nr:hypothetical protein [archaeon]
MDAGKASFCCPADTSPGDVLQQFVGIFSSRGWLNRNLRLEHGNRRYRIFCSEEEFLAYRINDNCSVSPGAPGWPVCMVTRDRIMEDSHLSGFASTEPSAYEWLQDITKEKIELI